MPKVTNAKVHIGAYANMLKRVRSKAASSEKHVFKVIDSVDAAQDALQKAAGKLDSLEDIIHELRGIVAGRAHKNQMDSMSEPKGDKKAKVAAKAKAWSSNKIEKGKTVIAADPNNPNRKVINPEDASSYTKMKAY